VTHNFKPGDKITMRVGARSMYGTHLGGMKGAVRYATGYGAYPLGVTFEGLPFPHYCVRPEDVLLAEDDTAKIKAALAVVKAKGGYCSDFDRAVEEAENLDLLGRLKAVAEKRNRGDIYFDAHPPKPEYQDGDRVHYTQDGWDWLVARIDGEWVWGLLLNDVWTEVAVESISAKEVKTWRFGDVVTEDNKPDVPFNAVDQTGRVRTESQSLDTGDTWRLIWLDGQELVCAATC